MKAISVVPGSTTLRLVERTDPLISAPDDVRLKVIRVGICGTDREEASGGRAERPQGHDDLIIGHEMFGRVLETGRDVTRVKAGDFAVFTVRRPCGACPPCMMDRQDMCETGKYLERGIWGLDGYQSEYAVDRERYIVRVPGELAEVGVLTEPLSVAEKAIDEAIRIQAARVPDPAVAADWLTGRRCMVAGLGPIGLLAGVALRLRGADVYGLDIVDQSSARPRWLTAIGGHYVDGRQVAPGRVDDAIGAMELIIDATGVAQLEFNLMAALAPNGIYVLTGIPGGHRPVDIQGADLIRGLVLGNQVMVGSVNAARVHFQMAVDDLASAERQWGRHLEQLITHRYTVAEAPSAIANHPDDEIKAVVEWSAGV